MSLANFLSNKLFASIAGNAGAGSETTQVSSGELRQLLTDVANSGIWTGSSVTGSPTDIGKLGTIPPLPGTQRMLPQRGLSQIDVANNAVLGQPLCATSTSTTQVKTTQQADFSVAGQVFRKAATDNFWTLTGAALAVSSWRKYLLLVDASGVATVLASTDSTVSAAGTIVPVPSVAKAVFGVVTIATDASHTFTPNTTALNAAGITATFIDGMDPVYTQRITASAPSIAQGAANGSSLIGGSRIVASTDGISAIDPNAPFRYFGAPLVVSGAGHDRVTAAAMGGGGTPNYWGVEWEVDSAGTMEFRVQGNGTNGAYRLMIDGVYANDITQLGPSAAYYLVTFPTAGVRRCRLELNGASQFISLAVPSSDTVWRPSQPLGPKVIVFGDSVPGGTGATYVSSGFVATLGNLMGWIDITGSGSGGTGLLAVGGKQNFLTRLQSDVIANSPDILIVQGSTNDVAAASLIQAAATTLINQVRVILPNCKIIFVGRYWYNGSPDQYTIDYKNAMALALAQDTGPNLFIDNIGTNTPGATTLGWVTAQNISKIIGADTVHPTQAGHDYWGYRLASAIAKGMPF